jgi:hypothetical protein
MMILQHKFVEIIPDELEEGVLYISLQYCTAIHKCACGCGKEAVTPISPKDWRITFDGKTVTLNPSIGNWNFECKSHYLIINSQVRFANNWISVRTKDEPKKKGRKKKRLFRKWFIFS